MESPQSKKSSSSKSLRESIEDNLINKTYLQGMTDKYISQLVDVINEQDPKKLIEKYQKSKDQQRQNLYKMNKQLIEKNKRLKQELIQAKTQISHLRGLLSQDNRLSDPSKYELYLKSNEKYEDCPQNLVKFYQISSNEKKQALVKLSLLQQNANKQKQSELKNLQKLNQFFGQIFQRLLKYIQLKSLQIQADSNQQQNLILISRQKYQKLIQFYIQSAPSLVRSQKQKLIQNQNQPRPFQQESKKEDQKQEESSQAQNLNETKQIIKNLSVFELQQYFTKKFEENGLKNQWERLISQKGTEAQKQLKKLKTIASGKDNKDTYKQVKQKNQKIKTIDKLNETNVEASTLIQIEEAEQFIEEALFDKITRIIIELNFTPVQIQLFKRFNAKRKCNLVAGLQDFIHKFKNKQDLVQISKKYSEYLVKAFNQFIIQVITTLTYQQQVSYAKLTEDYPWFSTQLSIKSNQFKYKISQLLEQQSNIYLDQKNPQQLVNPLKRRKQVKQILTPSFDQNKTIQHQLFRMVNEYTKILNSTLFFTNRKITATLS